MYNNSPNLEIVQGHYNHIRSYQMNLCVDNQTVCRRIGEIQGILGLHGDGVLTYSIFFNMY